MQSELEAQHELYGYNLAARNKDVNAQYARWGASRISPALDGSKPWVDDERV